jgi:hypothetical protein
MLEIFNSMMRGANNVTRMGENKNACWVSVGKLVKKSPVGRLEVGGRII